jgi:pyruvate ferredoxin oxidoreductase beta subunit
LEVVEKEYSRGPMAPGTSACQGCVPLLTTRQVLGAMGDNSVITFATGCIQAVSSVYPFSGWNIPAGHYCFNNVAAAASGVEVAFRRQKRDEDILVYGGDGGLADIGFQALSGAIERGHNLTYVCYDNEAYMNTGVQRSGTTPWMASTKTTPSGKLMKRKDLSRIMEAHGIYVATALPCFPADLARKVKKARDIVGPAFVHVLSPCPTGWEFDPALAIEISRLAFETGAWILYEYEDGHRTISRLPKVKKPIEEYLKKQGRFSHLTSAQIRDIQAYIDARYEELVGAAEVAQAV